MLSNPPGSRSMFLPPLAYVLKICHHTGFSGLCLQGLENSRASLGVWWTSPWSLCVPHRGRLLRGQAFWCKSSHVLLKPVCLVYFTERYGLNVRPFCYKWLEFILPWGRVGLYCVDVLICFLFRPGYRPIGRCQPRLGVFLHGNHPQTNPELLWESARSFPILHRDVSQ